MTHWIQYPLLSFKFSSEFLVDLNSVEYGVLDGTCIGGVYQTPTTEWGWFLAGKRPPTPVKVSDLFRTKKDAQKFVEEYSPDIEK